MWTYLQTGHLLKPDGSSLCDGYSGHGEGKNNPALQAVRNVGPIPCGEYTILAPYNHPRLGEYVMPLIAKPHTDTFGRGEFFLHGDSAAHPGEASHGCVVIPHQHRVEIWKSGDHELLVRGE